jgi:hypothetical protein
MRAGHPRTFMLAAAIFFAGTAAVLADGDLTITITNDSTSNLLVTVYDLNASPPQKVMTNQLINGFASVTVAISPDSSGLGHLSWTAMTNDPDMRQCGRRDKPQLSDGATVHVDTDGDCG